MVCPIHQTLVEKHDLTLERCNLGSYHSISEDLTHKGAFGIRVSKYVYTLSRREHSILKESHKIKETNKQTNPQWSNIKARNKQTLTKPEKCTPTANEKNKHKFKKMLL